MSQSAQSVVLQLLSAVPAGLPVGLLIAGCELMDISPNSVRVTLTRLKARALIASVDRGVYRLGVAAQPVQAMVAGWRDVESQLTPSWDGSWIAIHSAGVPKRDRVALRRHQRASRLLGFRGLAQDLHIRPNNLRHAVAGTRERGHELGLDRRALVFRVDELDETAADEAVELWDVRELEAGYRNMTKRLADAECSLPRASRERAARDAFSLGGEAIRLIVSDPLLPEPIVDTTARRALVAAMRHFDVFGRECWRRVLTALNDEVTVA